MLAFSGLLFSISAALTDGGKNLSLIPLWSEKLWYSSSSPLLIPSSPLLIFLNSLRKFLQYQTIYQLSQLYNILTLRLANSETFQKENLTKTIY